MIILNNKTLKELLRKDLTQEEIEQVRSSYDVIGSIAIIEVTPALQKKEKVIAAAVMQRHKNVTTVAKIAGAHAGEFRARKIKVILGKKTTETVHKESGVQIMVDIAKIYFSPRLATERLRIARMVGLEKVLVMFSGCGPYPLVIAHQSRAERIFGIEKNPLAHAYGLKNITLNKFKKRIQLIRGDAKLKIKSLTFLHGACDRILMPLPKDSGKFIREAVQAAARPCWIHYYTFSSLEEAPQLAATIAEAFTIIGRACIVKNIVKCGQYSPRLFRMCFDLYLM